MKKIRQIIVDLRFACQTSLCLVALLLLCNSTVMAQGNSLTGTVVSATDGEPIIGAAVVVVETSIGVVTDIDGTFVIENAPTSGQLLISYLGYDESTVDIQKGRTYNIKLSESSLALDQVVVVGYGAMRKKEVTGAVSHIHSDDLSKLSSSDIGTSLQGQVAGVNVTASSGEPGSTANIRIRGLSSINGSSTPLYVVDGVPQSGDPGLSTNEIESLDILKDAASAAIYGTRGSAGVILITTKKGNEGRLKVSFDGYYGVQNITSDLNLLDIDDYLYVLALGQRIIIGNNTDDRLWTQWQNYASSAYNNASLYDVILNNNAAIQNYSANVSGGASGVTYNVMANYYNQEGVIINSGFERYNIRGNINLKRDKFTLGVNVAVKAQNKNTAGSNLLVNSYSVVPTSKQVDPNTDISSDNGSTSDATYTAAALAQIKESNLWVTNSYTANINMAYELPFNIELSTRVGLGYSSQRYTQINPLFQVYTSDGDLINTAAVRSGVKEQSVINNSTTWETMLNWGQDFGLHNIRFTGVFSTEQYSYDSFTASIKDLVSTEIGNLNTGTADAYVSSGGTYQYNQNRTTTLLGMLARIQYNYDSRYMLSGSIRRDASSRFSPDNRWGVFPSLSAGWNVSEEKFWSGLENKISNFKVRASYGTTGNQNFSDYAFQTTIVQGYDYVYGNDSNQTYVAGAAQTSFANSDVMWETTVQSNFGIDMGFLNNKLTFTFDVYKSDKNDMLFPLIVPPSGGAGTNSTMILNVGDMTNQGVEFALQYRDKFLRTGNFSVNATFSTNHNEVVSMGGDSDMYYFSDGSPISGSDKVTVVKEGYEAGAFFMMPTDGLINTEAKLAKYQAIDPSYKMGDLAYVDQNGDGEINDDDRVYAGSGTPDYEIGFNGSLTYAGFDLYMNWYASIGNEIIDGTNIKTLQQSTSTDAIYQWSVNYPESTIPIDRGVSHNNYRAYADIWVQDGSFLRLKNISLGYDFTHKLIKSEYFNKIRVYVAADNLLTFTNYGGYDPEVGSNGLSRRGLDYGTYPISRQIRGGIQIEF